MLKLLLAVFACVIGNTLGNPVDRLKLWMTYDQVAKMLPSETRYSYNRMAEEYQLTAEGRKLTSLYHLDLEDEYGVVLGFNADKELVLINRIERAAELPEHVRMQMRDSPDLQSLAKKFRVGPGSGREESWRALQSLVEVKIAGKTEHERVEFIRQTLGEPDGVDLTGYRPRKDDADRGGKPARENKSRLSYLLNTHEWGHEIIIVDCRSRDEQDFVTKESIPVLPESISKEEADLAASLGADLVNLGLGHLDDRAKSGFSVSLAAERMDVETLKKVARLKALVSLSVAGAKFDDASLRLFEGHRYMASIRLKDTSVTAEGLAVLDSLRELKWVTISPPSFSKDEIEKVRNAVPRCSFELED